jgi:outer membrane immunogenic protein
MKKRLTIAALAAMAMLGWAGTATAADMPVKAPPMAPPPPTWTGMYIGINGGYGFGTSNFSTTGFTTGDFDLRGGLAGVTYGGNWQMGHAVLGFESDFDWAHINGNVTNVGCGATGVCFTNTRFLSTERMRAGWDFNGWLFYGTLGAAFADVNAGVTGCGLGLCGERWRAGWAGGVGIETMFWRNWSAKIEYLHYDLGNSIQFTPPPAGPAVSVVDRGDIIRAGINYHFDLLSLLHF